MKILFYVSICFHFVTSKQKYIENLRIYGDHNSISIKKDLELFRRDRALSNLFFITSSLTFNNAKFLNISSDNPLHMFEKESCVSLEFSPKFTNPIFTACPKDDFYEVKARDRFCEWVKDMLNEFDEKFGECMRDHAGSGNSGGSSNVVIVQSDGNDGDSAGQAHLNAFYTCYAIHQTDFESTFRYYKAAVEGGCNILSRYL